MIWSMAKKIRRNITIDGKIDEWLDERENASKLISNLLMAYRAYVEMRWKPYATFSKKESMTPLRTLRGSPL